MKLEHFEMLLNVVSTAKSPTKSLFFIFLFFIFRFRFTSPRLRELMWTGVFPNKVYLLAVYVDITTHS